ncbi:kelch-like protein, partial [Euroglyphus maynei]
LRPPPIRSSSNSSTNTSIDLNNAVKRFEYTSEKHPKLLLESLSILRRRRELCDVILVVGQRKIYAHRVLLAAYSPYFLELAESRQTEVIIRDIDEHAMELLIDFAYTSHIIIEENNVQVLLPAACLLQMNEIQEVCCEFLRRELDPSNCLGIRSFADTHSCQDLLHYADKYTQDYFQEVIENEEFLLLPVNQLIDIVSTDELNISTEEQVYNAIMKWVRYNVQERGQHLAHVLQHVRLSQMSAKFLVGTVSSDILVKNDEACRDLVDEAKNYLLLPQERSLMVGPRFRPRKPVRRGEVLFAAGGWCSGDAIASVERYEPQAREWRMVAPMNKRRCGVGCAVLNELLYAVGGHDGQSYLNSIERYDPHTNQWSIDVAPTSTCRTSVGVAVLDGYLYAVGGQDGVSCLNIVERYDPQSNRWTKLAGMTTGRLGVAVAVLGGYLYAIGGSDGNSPLNTVERYDPRTNRWNPVAPMWTRRKHLGCAVYNNMIYAVGGRDDTTELSSAERYNPQTDTWQPIVAMTTRRSGVGLAVVNGLLYAVGGFDGTTYLKTIEMYSPEDNQWQLCGSMNYRRLGGGVGVIRMSHPTESSFTIK